MNTTKRAALTIILLLAGATSALARQTINEVDMMIGSPQAGEMAKYGSLDVSLFKGVPNVSVPIYTLELKDFSLPIYLSYDAGGIKVDQVATSVGLGWSLHAGGQITASTHAMSDITNALEFPASLQYFDPNAWSPGGSSSQKADYDFAWEIFDPLSGGDPKNTKQDVYFYSYPGRSGKFIKKTSAGYASVPYANHSISYSSGAFQITDEHGNVFKFQQMETTTSWTSSCSGGGGSVNTAMMPEESYSWHMSEIVTTNGDVIEFEYQTENAYSYTARQIQQKYRPQGGNHFLCESSIPDYQCSVTYYVTPVNLTRIVHQRSGQEIVFGYSGTRDDVEEGEKLNEITIYNGTGTAPMTKYILHQDYFQSPGGSGYDYNRLRLDSLQVAQGDTLTYSFEYDTSSFPHRLSYGQDTWGYYNGQTSNSTLVPNGNGLTGAANRSVNTSVAGRWSLEKIHWPTGGSTVLNMEADPAGGGLRVASIHDLDGLGNTTGLREYSYVRETFQSPFFLDFYSYYVDDGDPFNPTYHQCNYNQYTASSVQPVSSLDGPDYGYTTVTIDFQANGEQGRSVVEFSGGVSDLSGTSGYSGPLSWGRGEQLSQTHYRYTGSGFAPVQKTENTYTVHLNHTNNLWASPSEPHEQYIYGLDIKLQNPELGNMWGQIMKPARFDVLKYKVISAWYHPDSTYTYLYDPDNASQVVQTATKREYDTTTTRLDALVEINSDQSIRRSEYTYGVTGKPSRLSSVAVKDSSGAFLKKRWAVWDQALSGRQELKQIWDWNEDSGTPGVSPNTSSDYKIQEIWPYDSDGNPLEVQDAMGVKTAYDWSQNGAGLTGIFINADTSDVFAHSFAYDGLEGWTFVDVGNDGDTEASISDGKLKLTNYASAINGEFDRVYYDHGSEITQSVVWEFDVQIANSNSWDLQMNAGGDSWNTYTGSTERAVWSAINNESWRTHNGSSWITLKTGLIVGHTYGFKIVMHPGTSTADYYINGEELATGIPFRNSSSGIQKIAFGNYGYGSVTTEWFIDNVRLYPEAAHAITREMDPVFGSPLTVKDVAGGIRRFAYDELGRLEQVRTNNGDLVEDYQYVVEFNGSGYSEANSNYIQTRSYTDTQTRSARQYFDGLGRPVQAQANEGSNSLVAGITRYDAVGREWKGWKAYPQSGAMSYDALYDTTANAYYSLSGAGPDASGRAFVETTYEASPLGRVLRVNPEGVSGAGSGTLRYDYGVEEVDNHNAFWTEITDQAGKKTRTWADGWGRTLQSTAGYGTGDAAATNFTYDELNQLKTVTSPEGLQTSYAYDKRGLLTQRVSPDAGTTEYMYDDNGQVRFLQDANLSSATRYLEYTYDFAGRKTLERTCSGALPSSLSATCSSPQQAIVYTYDDANATPSGVTFTINNAVGRLTKVDFQGGYYLYSYDTEGNIERMYNKLDGLSGRTITYDYNRLGEVIGVEMDGNPHFWEYAYDALGRLDLVKTHTSSSTAVDADYGYWPGGMVDTEALGSQTIDFDYDARDRLTSINDVASSSHPFSAAYTYFANGNILQAQYHQPSSPHSDKRFRFTHTYDNRNQLTQADYSYWNGSGWSTSTEFDLSSVSYDLDGNITAKTHNNASQSGSHTYSYASSSNRLNSISRSGADSLSFGYDANGNVTSLSGLGYSIGSVSYDWRNLPLSMNAGGSRTYRYDHAGARVYKSYEDVHYLRGAYGEILAVYEGGSLSYWNILGPDGTPIGRRESGGTLRYYHRDHLGSTRAVATADSVTEAYDFMPFGMEMDRSKTGSGPTRNKFTGHETDEETQLIHMEWRGYLAEFGRFLSVDPLADEYPSWGPYNYTLNNPLKFIDPTGLCPEQTNDSWCIDDFGFENHGLLGRIMNYLLTTDSEIGSENYNSRDFSEVVYEGVVDEVTEVANEVKEETLDVAETSVGIGILVADNVSLASDIALPAAFMFGPKGIAIVGGIGTVADVTSLGLKGVDLLMFDGSQEILSAQFKKTVFNYGKGMGLNKVSRYHR